MCVILWALRRTSEISTCAERPSIASDDSDPETLIFVELLPDLSDFLACGSVDTVEFLWSVQSDQNDLFSRESDGEVFVAVFF